MDRWNVDDLRDGLGWKSRRRHAAVVSQLAAAATVAGRFLLSHAAAAAQRAAPAPLWLLAWYRVRRHTSEPPRAAPRDIICRRYFAVAVCRRRRAFGYGGVWLPGYCAMLGHNMTDQIDDFSCRRRFRCRSPLLKRR